MKLNVSVIKGGGYVCKCRSIEEGDQVHLPDGSHVMSVEVATDSEGPYLEMWTLEPVGQNLDVPGTREIALPTQFSPPEEREVPPETTFEELGMEDPDDYYI